MQSACGKQSKQSLWQSVLPLSIALALTGSFTDRAFAAAADVLTTIIPGATAADIPAQGSTVDSFAPAGWKVFKSAEGDLNHDGRSDLAMIIVKEGDNPENFGEQAETSPRAVVVAFASAGSYKRIAVGYGPVMSGRTAGKFATSVVDINIVKGRLIVKNGNSASYIQAHELTFSWQHGDMQLTEVDLNACSLREPDPHSTSEVRDLNSGAVTRELSNPSDDTVKSSEHFWALRAPLIKTAPPQIDGVIGRSEWPGQVVQLSERNRANIVEGAHEVVGKGELKVQMQAQWSVEKVYVCAVARGAMVARAGKTAKFSLRLAGARKLVQADESKCTIKDGIVTVESSFSKNKFFRDHVEAVEYAPKRLNVAVQFVIDSADGRNSRAGKVVMSTATKRAAAGQISLCRRPEPPTLSTWTWEHPDD